MTKNKTSNAQVILAAFLKIMSLICSTKFVFTVLEMLITYLGTSSSGFPFFRVISAAWTNVWGSLDLNWCLLDNRNQFGSAPKRSNDRLLKVPDIKKSKMDQPAVCLETVCTGISKISTSLQWNNFNSCAIVFDN